MKLIKSICALFILALSVPVYADSNIDMGYESLNNHELDKALQFFSIELRDNPESASARLGIAKSYALKGYRSLAMEQVNEIIAHEPNNIEALFMQGRDYLLGNKLQEARDNFQRVVELDATHILGQASLLQTLRALGRQR